MNICANYYSNSADLKAEQELMCGIAGLVVNNHVQDLPVNLRKMTGAIAHRGPDDEGFYVNTTRDGTYSIGLGHRRLSIIDLSTGHQPMGNEDGSIQIVFNGEIYNYIELRQELLARGHRFATDSDTEVIVHAYEEFGESCVERFRGMFAFSIWDRNREKLFLARDHFGKKPLFFCEFNGQLLFASEIKSILTYPGVSIEVNRDAVWDYLAYRYVPGPATLFSGIRKLAPGSYALWEKGQLQERRYYIPPDQASISNPRLSGNLEGAFLDLLDEAVSIRMVSDVPFGAFLSGGIDSSAIVAMMARHSSLPVKTFSVGFTESGYSELDYARVVAKQFSTHHHELMVSSDHLMDELPTLVGYRDAPASEPADIPIYLLSKEASCSVKMVLTGEGADEFLGGYNKHVFERYVAPYQQIPALLRQSFIEPLVQSLPYRFSKVKTAILNLGLENPEERLPHWFGGLTNMERDKLVKFRPVTQVMGNKVQFDTSSQNSALRRILYFDQTSWLPDNLLERGDRMTMAASIESRMPFMDKELVSFISTLPDHYRVRKSILRKAMQQLLPKAILDRPKLGFRMPVKEWFRGPMRDYLYDHLTGPDSKTRDYFRRDMLDKLLNEHMQKTRNNEKLLWSLLNLEIWHRKYF